MRTCPNCHAPVNSTALVEAFNAPDGWLFWGTPGQRWIVCQSAGFIHFRVTCGHRQQHRMAIIHGQAGAWIAAERDAAQRNSDLLGTSRNHVGLPDHDYYAKQDEWLDNE